MANPLNTRDMIIRALKDEKTRQDNITKLMNRNPLLTKSAATRVANDVYAQQKRLDAELTRNKASAVKIERQERLNTEKLLAQEAMQQEKKKQQALRGLVSSTRQMLVGSVVVSAASVSLLSRTAEHFSPATAVRYERAMGSLAATVGMVLAPAFQKLTEFIEGAAKWVANLSPTTQKWLNIVVMIVAPLAVAGTLIGGMVTGVYTITRGFYNAATAVLAYAGALKVAAVAQGAASSANLVSGGTGLVSTVSNVASAAGGAGALGKAATGLGVGGAAKGLGLAGAGVIGAGVVGALGAATAGYSLFGGQRRRDNLEAYTRNLLGVNKGPLSYLFGWKQSARDKKLEAMYQTPENEALQSSKYPVQTMSSVLDVGRTFRQQSAQQSSLKSYEDYRQDGEIKVSEKDAKNAPIAGLNASIIALNAVISQAVGEFRTAK